MLRLSFFFVVVAGAGVQVAKHGNRAFTSKSGAADVLAALGIGLELPIETLEQALGEANICFLMAPHHHSAMRNVAGPRSELAPNRTIFNLLGPMSNPALVKRQLVGVFDRRWLKPVAEALGRLGLERALVVHGQDGMDELTTTTKSWAASLENGQVREIEIAPEDVGVKRATLADLKGGDPDHNAAAIRFVLSGRRDAFATPDELERETEAIPGPVTRTFVDGDHSLRRSEGEVADIVAAWVAGISLRR